MQSAKHAAILSVVVFLLSSAVGRALVSDCTNDCKKVQCIKGLANCHRFLHADCISDELYVLEGATGGTCTTTHLLTYLAQCPDCEPQCTERPCEATNCSPAKTPGCDPGVDCCQEGEEIPRALCNGGTAGP